MAIVSLTHEHASLTSNLREKEKECTAQVVANTTAAEVEEELELKVTALLAALGKQEEDAQNERQQAQHNHTAVCDTDRVLLIKFEQMEQQSERQAKELEGRAMREADLLSNVVQFMSTINNQGVRVSQLQHQLSEAHDKITSLEQSVADKMAELSKMQRQHARLEKLVENVKMSENELLSKRNASTAKQHLLTAQLQEHERTIQRLIHENQSLNMKLKNRTSSHNGNGPSISTPVPPHGQPPAHLPHIAKRSTPHYAASVGHSRFADSLPPPKSPRAHGVSAPLNVPLFQQQQQQQRHCYYQQPGHYHHHHQQQQQSGFHTGHDQQHPQQSHAYLCNSTTPVQARGHSYAGNTGEGSPLDSKLSAFTTATAAI